MYQQAKQIAMLPALLMIAGLSMGNQSCEQAQTRVLKMDVELSALDGRPVRLPNGELVDFKFAVNQLFYGQVMLHDHFVMVGSVQDLLSNAHSKLKPEISQKTQAEKDFEADMKLLEKYGFMGQVIQAHDAITAGEGVSEKTLLPTETLPACLYDMPQAVLGGSVLSFESSFGVGLGIGYGQNGPLNPGTAGGEINFSNSKLELRLRTDDPLMKEVQKIGDSVSHQSNTSFKFGFNPGIPVGLSFFFQESLSKTIRDGLDRGLDALVTAYQTNGKTWNDVWESRVMFKPNVANNDTTFVIRGGERVGIVVGDEFKITNMYYEWADPNRPCETVMKDRIPYTNQPSIEVKVIEVGPKMAIAQLKDPNTPVDVRIVPGAQVKILKLYQPPQTAKDGKTAQQATTAQSLN